MEARIQRADEKAAKAASGKERSEDSSRIFVGTFGGGPAKAGADGSFLLWHRALGSEPVAASDAGVSAGTGEVSGLFSGLPSDSDSAGQHGSKEISDGMESDFCPAEEQEGSAEIFPDRGGAGR